MKSKLKITLSIAILATAMVGCWIGYEHFSRSYIQEYIMYDGIEVRRHIATSTKNIDLYVNVTHRVNFLSEGNDKAMYDKLCEANGDISYNQEVHLPLDVPTIMCTYPHFAAINVYSNKDFDANHPAGTPLNDLMTISYCTAASYIASGYTADSLRWEEVVKPLNELGSDDLKFDLENILLRFTKDPDVISTHKLKFECINAEGKRNTITYDYDFSLPEGETEYLETDLYQ